MPREVLREQQHMAIHEKRQGTERAGNPPPSRPGRDHRVIVLTDDAWLPSAGPAEPGASATALRLANETSGALAPHAALT